MKLTKSDVFAETVAAVVLPQTLTANGISILKNNTTVLSSSLLNSNSGLAVSKHTAVTKTSSSSNSSPRVKFGWVEGVFIRFCNIFFFLFFFLDVFLTFLVLCYIYEYHGYLVKRE